MQYTSHSFTGAVEPGRCAVQGLAVSTFQVVLVPTLVGVVANEFFHDLVKKFTAWLPLVGVAITTLLCASPCAQVATVLKYVHVLPTAADMCPLNTRMLLTCPRSYLREYVSVLQVLALLLAYVLQPLSGMN